MKLSQREQVLSALVIVVLVVGAYGFLRFFPANQKIDSLQKNASATQRRLFRARIPDQPTEDIDKLNKELEELRQEIDLTNEMAREIMHRLAPLDSQTLKLHISQLAHNSGVYIRSNKKWLTKPANMQSNPAAKKTKKKKAQAKTEFVDDLVLPATASWVARMSPGTLFARPMQRLELEGSYAEIRQFIYGLSELSYQVTVLKINISKGPNEIPAGYAQKLVSELILAL